MFLIHQIVNVLIDPIVDLLLFVGIGGEGCVPGEDVVPLDDPKNTEEEARRYEEALKGQSALLVTSALHLPNVGALSRSVMVVHELVGRIRYAF